ncbi:MAG: DNA internalization-related competence protein ComEC/Rec2 [Lachnospiraceae bacterium]|nr:DNA internalization-related competence protein ComEC/Rec2 [Lachnospiraceae bacterium]
MRLSNFEKLLCRPLVLFTAFFIMGIMCRGPGRNGAGTVSYNLFDGNGRYVTVSAMILFFGGCICIIGEWKRLNAGAILNCLIWLICPVMFIAGYARTYERGIENPLKSSLSRSSDATVRGIISDISLRDDGYMLTISECTADIGQDTLNAEKINIIIEDCPYTIGDRISAAGKLYPFEPATNYGQFDSELYYRIRGIDAKMYADNVFLDDSVRQVTMDASKKFNIGKNITDLTSNNVKYSLKRVLFNIRMKLTDGIYEVLPKKEAGVLTAMLTGERGLLDSELKKLYSDGGIAHILSISALHVTLLGMGFFKLLMFLAGRLRLSCILTMLLMISYGAMTGFSVSTKRAVIMLVAALTARMIGKTYDRLSSCGFAALVILLIQPLYIYDSGFRLSFTAVIGINVILWVIEVYDIRNPVMKAFLPCIAVWAFILPVTMGTYYEISVYSILVNPLILIFMAILLMSGSIAGALASRLFAGPVYFILKMYEALCEFEVDLPYSKIVTGAPCSIGVFIYYSVLILVMVSVIRKKRPFSLIGIILCSCIFFKPHVPFEAHFLDVGQGDSAFIRCEDTYILVDGGSSNVSDVGNYRLIPFLKYMGVRELDTVIISHTDADHVNGIVKMIEEGFPKIQKVYIGENVGEDDDFTVKLKEAGITILRTSAGDAIGMKSANIKVIAPEKKAYYKDANEASMTVLVEYKDISLLMTGDSGTESEKRYVRSIEKPVIILKVAHHGSKYSTSEKLLDIIAPTIACISCSKTNNYGHPAPETLERLKQAGSNVFVTKDCGAITVKYNKDVRVECFVKNRYN